MKNALQKQYAGIDRFRVIAAVLVVAIHTSPLGDLSGTADFILTRIIARVAVPFFFMATGFFLFPKAEEGKPDSRKLISFLKKTALLYLAATLLYLPVNLYAKGAGEWRDLPHLLGDVVFNGTFYHLWYLPAAMLGSGIAWLLLRGRKPAWALLFCVFLYLIGLFGDSYYGAAAQVPALKAAYGAMFCLFDYTRNGLFFAPVFFLLGALIAGRPPVLPKSVCLGGLLASSALMIAEGLLLRRFALQRHDSMYVMLIPCMFFLFQSLMDWGGKSRRMDRLLSMLIYLIHPMMIVAVRGFAKASGFQGLLIENSLIHFLAVLSASLAVSLTLAMLLSRSHKALGKKRTDRAWVEINLENLRHNVKLLRGALPRTCEIMAVVKANAYGHGDVEVSKILNRLGISSFAVATIDEAVRLRRKGVRGEILILGYTPPSRAGELSFYRLTQTVVDAENAKKLGGSGRRLRVQVKVNTGMNRLGENDSNVSEIVSVFRCKNLKITGIYTHLSVSDSAKPDDVAFTDRQIRSFYSLLDELRAESILLPKIHIQSSYGVLNYPELSCDYARVGLALYGILSKPGEKTKVSLALRPVLSMKSRVTLVRTVDSGESVGYGREFTARRETKIAVVSIGFADGVPRSLSAGKGTVLVRGRRAPVAGRVCMDQLMIDVTGIPDVSRGDAVTLIGSDGPEEITAEEAAQAAGTITNELLSRLGGRLRRVYSA